MGKTGQICVATTSRRTVLKTAGTAPWLLGAIAGCTTAASPPPGDSARADPAIIDVHCHLFNASDLPVRGFVQRVVLGDPEDQVVLGPDTRSLRAALPYLAALLVELLSGSTPTAEEELASMDGFASRTLRIGPPRPASAADVERLRRALESVLEPAAERRARIDAVDGQPPSEQGRIALFRAIAAETGAARGTAAPQQAELPYEAMARGLLAGRGTVSRYVQWALWLTRSRQEIVERAVSLYGGAQGVVLFTPALIDFSQWLEEEPRQGSDLEDQIRVMERLQRLPLGAVVHCFAPYDPWRQIVDEEDGRRPSAFDLVTWAVQEMGFVGVKLYPPMGFLPAGNTEVSQTYPVRADEVSDFPRRLDAALDKLYAWAAAAGVPVMAHASNSNGAADEYSERANPKGWSKVLARYPELRLKSGAFRRLRGKEFGRQSRRCLGGRGGPADRGGPQRCLRRRELFQRGAIRARGCAGAAIDGRAHDGVLARVRPRPSAPDVRQRLDHARARGRITRLTSPVFRTFSVKSLTARPSCGASGRGTPRASSAFSPGDAARQRLDTYYRKHQLNSSWLAQFASTVEA